MANPSIDRIVVWTKTVNDGGGFDWDVEFTTVTSKGTRSLERKVYTQKTKAQLWDAIRQVAIDYDTAEQTGPAAPVKEFPDRYDATKGSLTALAPADYPAGEVKVA